VKPGAVVVRVFENEAVGHPASGDRVVLTIPSKPQYVGLCRLALAALATRDQLAEEVVADLKVAVSEACALFVPPADDESADARAVGDRQEHAVLSVPVSDLIDVTVEYALFDDHWAVEVSGSRDVFSRGQVDDPTSERGLGITIIRALVDQLELPAPEADTAVVRLVKHLA
jgi:serine/threonine-protein kinase RsbW